MKEDKDAFDAMTELQNGVKEYAEIRIQLLKAEATEKVAQASGQMIASMCIGMLFLVAILFLSIVAGLYFSDVFGSAIKGFAVVAFVYFFLAIILLVFRNAILIKPIANRVVSILYKEDGNEAN